MEYVFFIIVIVAIVIWGFVKNKKEESQEKKREELETAGVIDPYRQFMATVVPAILEDYNIFQPEYLQKFADQFERDGSTIKFTKEDLLDGADGSEALWTLEHCKYIASMRYHQSRQLNDAKEAGFDVELKFDYKNPNCSQVPSEQKFKPGKAPVYPCADCKEEKPCQIWYKLLT